MKILQFVCAQVNDLFSQEYANTHHHGEESEDNIKYFWEDELEVKNVVRHSTNESGTYILRGEDNGAEFAYSIENLWIFSAERNEGDVAVFAISKKLILDKFIDENSNSIQLTVLIKDEEPFVNPVPGIYIANADFPSPLIQNASR